MNERQLRSCVLTLVIWLACVGLTACSSNDGEGVGRSSGGAASGAVASGAVASGGDPSAGTASGTVASGGVPLGGAPPGGAFASGGSAVNGQFPADTSADGIAAFLATESYKSWAHKPAPYPPGALPYHGDLMLAYFNEVAVATHDRAAIRAMTVKELYDASGNQVGIAAALKTSEEEDLWTYYCTEDPPGNGCTNGSSVDYPVYEVEQFYTGCALCHTDAIISSLP